MTKRARELAERGLTLIEIMVVVAIIIIFVGLGALAFSNLRAVELDTSASLLKGTFRYVHSLAIEYNKPYRVVIDMDEGEWWTESAGGDDPCQRYVAEESLDELNSGEDGLGDPEDLARLEEEDPEEAARRRKRAQFQKEQSRLLTGRLGSGTAVTRVLTVNMTSPQQEGKVALHFFPSGQAEAALVWLGEQASEEDEVITYEEELTLELFPLGRLALHADVLDPDELGKEML